ncbi:tRNA dihydrouridine synthase DusB [Candidatus Peribacteria bacterium]|jgi:tRNA-dihydrouridine synthase B|nr:tRNA dihydrouridine synthase DusB [Candidatus Peribacteria bacterium]MBT4020800.1 tRNA dihydrouridine synthase DusB [Candidatus Peribacteria bacterium]MBT4241010.1 tRNA dihydrouridine synthase DusB [Candidatus Peribacteria bacterium]MBT4474492.1 tRNA dihydrouridine synthase DusB [Candidatus Peribacteria bacterium]
MFDWKNFRKPIIALAPMAGVTDISFRQFVKSICPEVVVFTEFVSTNALFFRSEKTRKMMEFDPELERPFIVQVFGADKDSFIYSCKCIEELGADGIDINMGCPAAKIVSSCYGSGLMRKPELAADLVKTAVDSVSIPVSVKTRLGWENSDDLIPFCKGLEDAGACALTIHGRTYKQKFEGESDWNPIYDLKKEVSIPVIGNGDIASLEDAKDKLGNLDGIMVGRAAMGNPWLLREMCNFYFDESGNLKNKSSMTFEELSSAILTHCEIAVRHKGEERGIREMRKHFCAYIRGFSGAKDLRIQLMDSDSLNDVKEILRKFACTSGK